MFIKSKNKAFTISELIIIIVVIGLLSILAIPKFINVQRDAKVSTMLRDINAIESIIPVYFSKTDNYPIKSVPYTPGEAFETYLKHIGDGGPYYEIDKTLIKKQHTSFKNDGTFILSIATNRVYYAEGIANGDNNLCYSSLEDNYIKKYMNTNGRMSDALQQVELDNFLLLRTGENKYSPQDTNITIKGVIDNNNTISIEVNDSNIEGITYEEIALYTIDKNIYAANVKKRFYANIKRTDNNNEFKLTINETRERVYI